MFNSYNSIGPLYIIMDKTKRNKVGDYEKYQINFETAQFMDSSDEDIDFGEEKKATRVGKLLYIHILICSYTYICVFFFLLVVDLTSPFADSPSVVISIPSTHSVASILTMLHRSA